MPSPNSSQPQQWNTSELQAASAANEDFRLRGDGTAAGKTLLYHKEGGVWVPAIP